MHILLFSAFQFTVDVPNSNMETPIYHTDSLGFIESQKSPRFIKSHLPGDWLPEQIFSGSQKPKVAILYKNRNKMLLTINFR